MKKSNKKQQIIEDIDYDVDITKQQTALKQQQEIEQLDTHKKTEKKKLIKQRKQEIEQALQQQNKDYSNKDKLDSLQFYLQKANEQNQILYQQIYLLESDLKDSKQLIQKLQNESKWKNQYLDQLNFRFEDSGHSDEKMLSNARFNSQTLMIELEHRDREIKRLQEIINERNEKLKVITVLQEKDLDKSLQLSNKIQILESENKSLKNTINERNYENNKLVTKQMAEGTFKVELDHLRSDVKRLVKMLKKTNEFKDFALIADDDGSGIRFLKDIKIQSDLDSDCTCKYLKPGCPSCVDEVIDEKMLWCPEEAWKFAHDFRLKYKGEMTEKIIERLLFELNKIWTQREKIIAKQIRNECAFETAALRRQLHFTQKYDEHQTKNTNKRLRNDIDQIHKENRELFQDRATRNPPGVKFVQETIKISQSAVKSKKDSDEQNKILKQQLSQIENQQNISNDKGKNKKRTDRNQLKDSKIVKKRPQSSHVNPR